MRLLPTFLLLGVASTRSLSLFKRDQATCSGLNAQSNDGNRKIAIVIDSSGSMTENDPNNLRLTAGEDLDNWLISVNEATGNKKADLVTVIDFDDTVNIDYPLGNPGDAANSAISAIDADGGTYIAGGVTAAITQLTSSGSGSTKDRSGIIVLTDGEDADTETLVNEIKRAASLGIRVSFGYLSLDDEVQDPTVLTAITLSGGTYAGIIDATSVQNWVDLILVNGLTHNDNPVGNSQLILPGLSISHIITGTHTDSLIYQAQNQEQIVFSVSSITAGSLTAEAFFGGKSLQKITVDAFSTLGDNITVTSPGTGEMTVKVSSHGAPKDALYTVLGSSNLPIQNCTVGIKATNKTGLSTGAKAGLGVGIPVALGVIGLGVFLVLKKFLFPPKTAPATHAPPQTMDPNQTAYMDPKPGFTPQVHPVYPPPQPYSPPPQPYMAQPPMQTYMAQPPMQPYMQAMAPPIPPPTNAHHQHQQQRSRDNDQDGSDCECSDPSDLENESDQPVKQQPGQKHKHKYHRIKWKREDDPKHHHHGNLFVECKDDKCPLNDKKHKCETSNSGGMVIPCACDCQDPNCPSNTPEEKRRRRREKRRREFAKSAFATGRGVVMSEVKHQALGAVGF